MRRATLPSRGTFVRPPAEPGRAPRPEVVRAVVVKVTVAVAVPAAASVTGDVTVQVGPAGAVVGVPHVSAMLPAKPLLEVNFRVADFPHFQVNLDGCKDIISTTITLERLRGVHSRRCLATGCSNLFIPGTAHARDYCSEACKHREVVRRSRAKSGAKR